jgi:tetratricopeptide (TPR) repeat protein
LNANRKHDAANSCLIRLPLLASLAMLLVAGFGSPGCMAPSAGPRQTGATATAPAADAVRVWSEQVTLPTYAVHPDPVPRFQVTDDVKYYPYSSQRDIAWQSKPQTWTAVCMENRYLKVMIMPELGGRLFAMYDKLADRDVIYRQKSIKPGRVGTRGAWICGGIEYDFPDSHSVTTHDKVHWTTRQYPDGSAAILIGDVERISRMGWTVEFRMAVDRASMEDRIYLHNRTPMRQRYYYWTNAGIEAGEKTQMILPFPKVTGHFGNGFADWPVRDGVDWSWFWKYPDATSTFGIGGQESFIGAYDHDKGVGVAHYADRREMPGRKFWTWGVSPAGMRWYDVLSDDKRPYAELQAGPMLTQSLYAWMQPYESQRFQEVWIPISRIGPFVRANPEAAVRLTVEKDEATVGVLPMRTFASAQVDLCAGQRVLQTWTADLAPEKPLLRTVKVDASDAASLRLVVRDSRGQGIIEHTLGTYALKGNVPTTLPTMDPQGMTLPASASAETATKRYELQWLHCDYADAARTIEDALAKWPNDPQVRFDAGLFRLFQGQPAKACVLLQPLVDGKDVSLQAKYYLALAKMQTGEAEGASRLLAEVRMVGSGVAEAATWTRAARILGAKGLLRAGRFNEALALLEPVLRSDPDYPYAAALCIYASRREGKHDAALRVMHNHLSQPDLEPMARLEVQQLTGRTDPTLARMLLRDPEVPIELACDYISVGDWKTAEAILTGGCGENACSGMTWLMAGYCAAMRGEKDKVVEYRTKAEAAPPEMVFPSRAEELAAAEQMLRSRVAAPRAAYYAGLVLMRLMRYDEAIVEWRRAIDAKDDNALARRSLAMALSAVKKDQQGAIAHLERAISIDPRQPVFYQDLATLYSALGRPADARDVLARSVRAAPATDALVTSLAEASLSLGQYRQAVQALADHRFNATEGRYGVHDDYAVAWVGVALQALLKDDSKEALAALNKALEYPENLSIGRPAEPQDESMIHYWRGVALQQLGKPQEATQAFELSVKQASSERGGGRRGGFYGTVNTAHSVLALRALARTQAATSQAARLTKAPSTNRWMQGDWYRSFMAFRGAWAQVLEGGAPGDGSLFDAIAKDPQVPAQWPRLSMLVEEALRHGPAPAAAAAQRAAVSQPAS